MELSSPLSEHDFVVRQKAPEERINLVVAVAGEGEGHGNRQRVSVLGCAPFFVIGKRKPPMSIARDTACFAAVEDGDQFLVRSFLLAHFLFPRAAATIESISTGGGPLSAFAVRASPAVNGIPRASRVRRIRLTSARGLPFSTSTIHWRLTPTFSARDF